MEMVKGFALRAKKGLNSHRPTQTHTDTFGPVCTGPKTVHLCAMKRLFLTLLNSLFAASIDSSRTYFYKINC
jgi:hypothetical protein